MKRLISAIIFVSCCALFNSCTPVLDNQENLWLFTYYSGEKKPVRSLLTPASFLNLQAAGKYTCDFGKFDFGRWFIKENSLFLINNENDTTTFPIKYQSRDDLQLFSEKEAIANFEAKPLLTASAENNPFSLVNNRWRITPAHKESELEIKERLQLHLQFWITYFNWALQNNIELVDVRSTASPIKIYGNGFTLKPYNDLPAAWKNYFFDTEDCRIANNMIHEVLQHQDIAWPQTNSKYKMFISAFQQLQEQLDNVVIKSAGL